MAPKCRKVFVIGVGMTAFQKPRGKVDYAELGLEATVKALLDAGLNYDDIEAAYVGYCFAATCAGQRALYQLGMTGIPITNVTNACSTGSTALFHARQLVEYGVAECTLAMGFEVMAPGSIPNTFENTRSPMDKVYKILKEERPESKGPPASLIFGNGGQEYIEKYGAKWEHIAAIAAKNHHHSVKNPYSQFRNDMTVEEAMKDKPISNRLSRAMCCPTSDGGAAVIVASEDFVRKHGLENQAIEMLAQCVATDTPRLYSERSAIELTGADMTRKAAKEAFAKAGLTPNDMKVVELHDCFAPNELLLYDALGLCEEGEAAQLIESKNNTYGGKWVINPSGGLLSKGHPLGATGLGMIFYIATQLRGIAGPMQIPELVPGKSSKPQYGLAHNLGLGGSCSVSILGLPSFFRPGGPDGRQRVGYEFGYTCKGVSQSDIEKVRSRSCFSAEAFKSEPLPNIAPKATTGAIAKL